MTILHFSSATSWRGGEQQIAYLIEALAKQSVNQIILCVEGAPLAKHCQKNGIQYHAYQKRSSINPIPGQMMAKLCKANAVNLVHIHDAHAHTYACIGASVFGAKTPFILSRRVDFPIRKSALSRWKYNHPSIKAIICVSHFIKSVIQGSIQEYDKVKVVHSGVDLNRFSYQRNEKLRNAYNIPKGAPLIVNVAAIAPHKDYFTFVDTAKLILEHQPEARFLIIGADGGEAESVRQYVQRLQLSEYIKFTGFRKDIPETLPGADVFLFTSKEEGLGTSLLDALACKVPVVATEAGGIPEIIEHEVSGLLAPVKNAAALAKEVISILENNALKSQIIQGGVERLKAFDKEATAAKTLQIYKSILGKR